MSCSGHHFSVHSPDCKAHMSIQSNRPLQVEPLASNSRITTPLMDGEADASMLQIEAGQPGSDCHLRVISPAGGPTGTADSDNNYTLVILDCSPHPSSSPGNRAEHHIDQTTTSAIGYERHSSGGYTCCYENAAACQGGGCHCQTQLIVRQQIEHDHSCQHYHNDALKQNERQYMQTIKPQHQRQQRANRQMPGYDESSTTTTTTTTARSDTQAAKTYNNSIQRQQPQRHLEDSNQQQTVRRQQQQRHVTHENFLEPGERLSGSSQESYQAERDYRQQQWQRSNEQQVVTRAMHQHQEQQALTGRREEARPGTRLVKKWDWNRAEFVEEEVPERTRRAVAPGPPTSGNTQADELLLGRAHQSGISSQASTGTPGGNIWNQELAGLCAELSPNPLAGQQQQQQYDPSWLAYRKPDEESVQADPLYRDLMAELQRLEEGVSASQQQQPPIELTPDCQQRPAFGQPLAPAEIELNEYENVEFIGRLIPNSDPTMRVEWTKNGRPLLESSRLTCEYEFGVVRLVIRRCEAEDSGIYQCRALNQLGEAHSRTKLLVHAKGNVQYETLHPAGLAQIRALENPPEVSQATEETPQQAPKFLSHIQDYVEKDEGEAVHFECCLGPVDDPDMRTEWFFNGRPLVTGSRFHTIDDFGFIVLDIDWLFPRDTGEYICRATNKHGSDFTRTVMRVRPAKNIVLESQLSENADATIDKLRQLEFPDVEPEQAHEEHGRPAHFVEPLCARDQQQRYLEGDNVHFEARVGPATDGELQVDWFHNGKPLISGHRFKPTFDFGHILLDILYVYPEDSGCYKCVARNALGEAASEFEISVQGKEGIVYKSQLPKEMQGGVEKLAEMEAMWNRAPDPEEDEAPAERMAPQFVLQPKPCTAFEGSCARFCCRIVAHPRPRVAWFINNQLVVSGSRYKLTHDGMYHLTIPKCALTDAGQVEVRARNMLGECRATSELQVRRKVDDYRGVLKNSPNPWYDETTLKMYRRQKEDPEDEDFEEFLANFQKQRQQQQQQQQQAAELQTRHRADQQEGPGQLHIATEMRSTSPMANQVIGYMEPGTPDVNLLLLSQAHTSTRGPPLVEPGDLHPVVLEQQAIMAPAPSTIQRALRAKDQAPETPPTSFVAEHQTPLSKQSGTGGGQFESGQHSRLDHRQQVSQNQRVFGLTRRNADQSANQQKRQDLQQDQMDLQLHSRQQQLEKPHQLLSDQQQQQQQPTRQRKMPLASPENTEHGREIHSHFHTQLQVERRPNKEITREIIEKETFEQEHSGSSRDKLTAAAVAAAPSTGQRADRQERARSVTPSRLPGPASSLSQSEAQTACEQQQHVVTIHRATQQRQQQRQLDANQDSTHKQMLIEDNMIPPEFTRKIQPCQAIDGDEARFECSFRGEPEPTISWFRESKLLRVSNLYSIETNLSQGTSALVIKRATLGGNAVYTVKAENVAGSAKSSANLVVEPHPRPSSARGGHARQFDALDHLDQSTMAATAAIAAGGASQTNSAMRFVSDMRGFSPTSMSMSDYDDAISLSSDIQLHLTGQPQAGGQQTKVIKSVRTRRLSPDDMTALIRASPDNLVAPTFLHTIHEVHSRPGELARLDARLIGSQPMEVKWLRNGERVRPDKQHKLLLEGDLYTLLILECAPADEGHYECVASNSVGEARCSANLRVSPDGRQSANSSQVGPTTSSSISSSSSSFVKISTEPAQISSSQSTSSTATTTTTAKFVTSSQEQQKQQMGAAQVGAGQRQHFGRTRQPHHQLMSQYTASGDQTTTGSSALSSQPAQMAIPKLIKGLENQQVREGQSVTLRCHISAFPKAEVSWFKQGDKPIKPSKYFRIFKEGDETHCLKILETFAEDQGQYRCVARAQNGQIETRASISVIPSSPK